MKRSQIQIGETIAVLFVFFILVVVGFVFYVKIIKGNVASAGEESSQLKSLGIAQRIMFMPEIQCSQDVVQEISNCVDKLKLESAQKVINQNEIYYYDLLGFSDITISQIYPQINPPQDKWSIYSRKIEKFNDKFVTNVPISIYYPTTRTSGFGVLTIESYS